MDPDAANPDVPLIGSEYDLRLSLGEKVAETDMRGALETGDWGFVHSFTTGSAVDGPGVRVVAWLTGCQFRCIFCHNPDTWKLTNGMPVSLKRAVELVNQYRHSLRTMKGGLTVSGGEPLLQHRFLLRLFAATKKLGVHTALDTNGYLGASQDNKPVHDFARRLAALRRPVWVRFVVVPGWTDDLDEVGRMAEFAAGLGNVERVEVLPFHQLGRFKWERLGMDYQLRDAEPPSRETVERVTDRFRSSGLAVV